MQHSPPSLLLVTHVAIRTRAGRPSIDDQTAAGIAQWCRHFEKVGYIGIEDAPDGGGASSAAWIEAADIAGAGRCEISAMPRAYGLGAAIRTFSSGRARLREAVSSHRHLCFTFGGLVGDWPAIAAWEAIRQKRQYGAWIDRVEPQIIRNKMTASSVKKRILWSAMLPLIELNTRRLLQKSSIALLQGLDTFNYYAALSTDPHCTYDTHTQVSDQIAPGALQAKQARIGAGEPLRILYVGRAAEMKGPVDWLDTLERLHQDGVPFQATWIGDGSELPGMRRRVAESVLSGAVEMPGFEGDRDVLLAAMRDHDLFLFCHKTAESPRCLIEALVSGCPLVGYGTAYSRGLVAAEGGGVFVPQGDVSALADEIGRLHRGREAMERLLADAAASGTLYDEDSVYAHRADLMKRVPRECLVVRPPLRRQR